MVDLFWKEETIAAETAAAIAHDWKQSNRPYMPYSNDTFYSKNPEMERPL